MMVLRHEKCAVMTLCAHVDCEVMMALLCAHLEHDQGTGLENLRVEGPRMGLMEVDSVDV